MLNGTANAAQITNVAVSDFENSVVTVSGTAEEENVSIVLIKQGETLDFKEYAEADDVSIQSVKSSDGKFEVSFKFEGSDGNYELYATDSETSYPFEFISKKTI